MAKTHTVPRGLRILNLLALVLFLAGAGFHLRSWFGMRGLRSYVASPDEPIFAGMARFDHFWILSRIGNWLVIAALGVAVLAALGAVIARRRA